MALVTEVFVGLDFLTCTPAVAGHAMHHATNGEQVQHNKTFNDMHSADIGNSMTTGYTMEVKPVLDVGEDLFLNERFVAVCQVQNAGGIRCDFVRFVPRG